MTKVIGEFRDLRRGDRTYSRGKIILERDIATLEVEVQRRIRIGHPKTLTILETITPSTVVSCKPPMLTIGSSTFTVTDSEALSKLLFAASEPRIKEGQRRREKVKQAVEAVEQFLVQRAGALGQAYEIELEPRRTLAVFTGDSDPVRSFMDSASNGLKKAFSEASTNVSGLKVVIGEEGVRRVYAAIYATGKAQDAVFSGDEELLTNAVTLVERAIGRTLRLKALRDMQIKELTELISAAIRDFALALFNSAEETLTCAQ